MDSYITKKRGTGGRSLFNRVVGNANEEQPKPESYKVDSKTGRALDSQYSTRDKKYKDSYPTYGEDGEGYSQVEEEYKRGPGFFERIIKIFRVSSINEEEVDEFEEEMTTAPEDDEVKEVLRITVKWLKMLPPEDIEEVKSSNDFVRYKELLKKYNLIK